MMRGLCEVMPAALMLTLLVATGCGGGGNAQPPRADPPDKGPSKKAIFAGGCFWCMEPPFEKLDGVADVLSGYAGGTGENPTYDDYAAKGHIEVIEVAYDPSKISYDELLEVFWRQIDPTDGDGQFVDRGPQYRSAIFYLDDEQRKLAEASRKALGESGRFDKPIKTEILKAGTFYRAEEYHQDYYKNHGVRYKYYRGRSGRDAFLDKTWGKDRMPPARKADVSAWKGEGYVRPEKDELKKRLSPLQYKVTQLDGTEPAFKNEYWDNKREGIYVDVVSGEPLFLSLDKYESGTGWPSFTKPLAPENIVTREDNGLFSRRTEVRSKHGNSHLGHVFPDGPPPTGQRFCMNSAALRFVARENLEKEGYGQYGKLFEK